MKGEFFFEQMLKKPQFSNMHPQIAAFFKDYLANEKVVKFNDQFVMNTHFPPFPGRAFDNLVEHFNLIGNVSERRLFSVTLAVTNRCNYRCWHCYNAGRAQQDMPLSAFQKLAAQMQKLEVVHVTLTGGEPLLRKDLEDIANTFDEKTNLTLNTTGNGLTDNRARSLRESGIFAVGVSLDSIDPNEHDQLRGKKGAFDTSLNALKVLSRNGLYPYIIAVATHEFLVPERFWAFIQFASNAGALEVHLLEPSATGKLAGRSDVLLKRSDRELIFKYQKEVAQNDDLPILSSFLYLESPNAFGCGAGLTHFYIDGSGELCPCNLVPASFGNINNEPLVDILNRMGTHFRKPRTVCAGKILSKHIQSDKLPIQTAESIQICDRYLPQKHPIPRFFQVQSAANEPVGRQELQKAYDQIHEYYEDFWLKKAGKPIKNLINQLRLKGRESVFEAGCGTGFASVLIAEKLDGPSQLIAADISEGMLSEAYKRAKSSGIANIQFVKNDALRAMDDRANFDVIFSSWVLGYIPLKPFFEKAFSALKQDGKLAFIVHKDNSPDILLEIFKELVGKDPSILKKQILFDFPKDLNYINRELTSAGFRSGFLSESSITFRYNQPEQVLDHLLKSGAGTVYYDALEPDRRKTFEHDFVKMLIDRNKTKTKFEVTHDYIACIAIKTYHLS